MITRHLSAAITAITIAILLAGCTEIPVEQADSFEILTDLNLVKVRWHKVTIVKDTDVTTNDILIKAYVYDDNVKISAYSESGKVLMCTVGDQAIEGAVDNNVYTFTLSDIAGDIVVTIGYLKFTATIGFTEDSYTNEATLYINGDKVDSEESISVPAGTDVIYSVCDVADGYIFSGWYHRDGEEPISKKETYTVKAINADVAYYATVRTAVSNLTVNTIFAGTSTITANKATIEPGHTYNYETESEITLIANPATGYQFVKWCDAAAKTLSTENPYSFTLTSDNNITAIFAPEDALGGVFTVAADEQGNPTKKVRFSKGNLWYGKVGDAKTSTFNFECNQYDTKPSETGIRDESHISHFMWCGSPENAMAMKYDMAWNIETPFFAEKDFTVNGFSNWFTMTNTEWFYLLDIREMSNGQAGYTNKTDGVTIDNTVYYGLFIYPDDYVGKEVGDDTEGWSWDKINSAGIVFLPATGFRVGTNGDATVQNVGKDGYYWSAMPGKTEFAFYLYFFINGVHSSCNWNRRQACSVRLVTESL